MLFRGILVVTAKKSVALWFMPNVVIFEFRGGCLYAIWGGGEWGRIDF